MGRSCDEPLCGCIRTIPKQLLLSFMTDLIKFSKLPRRGKSPAVKIRCQIKLVSSLLSLLNPLQRDATASYCAFTSFHFLVSQLTTPSVSAYMRRLQRVQKEISSMDLTEDLEDKDAEVEESIEIVIVLCDK